MKNTKRKAKPVQAVRVPQFESGHVIGLDGTGCILATDTYGEMWRIDANSGVATKVEFK